MDLRPARRPAARPGHDRFPPERGGGLLRQCPCKAELSCLFHKSANVFARSARGRPGPVAQISKSAVSPASKSAGRSRMRAANTSPSAGLETCDTADLEICATRLQSIRECIYETEH